MDEFEGMFFSFAEEKPLTFWMKNTWIPLDIIYINSDYDIVKIQQAVTWRKEPCKIYPSEKPAKYVVEVNKGFTDKYNIKEGSRVEILKTK